MRTATVLIPIIVLLTACGGRPGDLSGDAGGGGGGGGTPILPPTTPPALSGLLALAAGDRVIRADFSHPGPTFEAALFLGPIRATVFTNPAIPVGPTDDHLVFAADGNWTSVTGISLTDTAQTWAEDQWVGFLLSEASGVTAVITGSDADTLEFANWSGPTPTAPAAYTITPVNDTTFVGLGIREPGASAWTQVGQVLRCRPTTTNIYVDAAANPAIANGLTPATAFNNLQFGLFAAAAAAFTSDGANVLIRDGDYTNGPFPLGPDVHVYGGFQAGFDFGQRDPLGGNTRLIDANDPDRMIVDVLSSGDDSVLDGLIVDGGDRFTEGIDVTDSDCEIRSVTSRRLVDRGSRVRTFDFTTRRTVLMVACDISENGNDGLGVSGVIDLTLDRCSFNANREEGVDGDDLFANHGETATFVATGCNFFGNGLDGLDIDLSTPPLAGQSPGGVFDVRVDGCNFERNGLDGLIIDQDYDLFPNWYASIRVRDCNARANGLAGVHIDADNPGDYVIERLRSTANQTDGLLITSETNAGLVSCSASYFAGNQGHGIRTALGNKMVLATHCVFTGNLQGGFVAQAVATVPGFSEGSAVSCIAWRQSAPFTNVRAVSCFEEELDSPFVLAPNNFVVATASDPSNSVLTTPSTNGISVGDTVEIADDDVVRMVTTISPTELIVSPAPATVVPPDSVFRFDGGSVTEDLRLTATTPARGTGLAPPGAMPVDPGTFGAVGGGMPGVLDPLATEPMHLLATLPSIVTGVVSTEPIVLTFDQPLDPASITPDRVRCVDSSNNSVIAAGVMVDNEQLRIIPPPGGWTAALTIELHAGITSMQGLPFGGALIVPVHRR